MKAKSARQANSMLREYGEVDFCGWNLAQKYNSQGAYVRKFRALPVDNDGGIFDPCFEFDSRAAIIRFAKSHTPGDVTMEYKYRVIQKGQQDVIVTLEASSMDEAIESIDEIVGRDFPGGEASDE